MKGRAVIAGALAQKRASGGHTWVLLNWLLGLRRLGWDVLFLDSHGPDMFASAREEVANLDYVSSVMKIFGLDRCWSVLDRKTGKLDGYLDKMMTISEWCRELDVPFGANIIVGHPGETEQSLRTSAAYMRRLFLDPGEEADFPRGL